MKRALLTTLFLVSVPLASFSTRAANVEMPTDGFTASRYEALWNKSPFAVASPEMTQESSAYSLVGIAQFDGISYASLIDKQKQEHFLLSTKNGDHGLTLISITGGPDAPATSAVIQKEGQLITLKLESLVFHPSPTTPRTALAIPAIPCPPRPVQGNLPLLFQAVDPNDVKLSDDQKTLIERLRRDFIEELGPYQNPNDPEYQKRWKEAQLNLDDTTRGMLGQQAFAEYQAGVVHQASKQTIGK